MVAEASCRNSRPGSEPPKAPITPLSRDAFKAELGKILDNVNRLARQVEDGNADSRASISKRGRQTSGGGNAFARKQVSGAGSQSQVLDEGAGFGKSFMEDSRDEWEAEFSIRDSIAASVRLNHLMKSLRLKERSALLEAVHDKMDAGVELAKRDIHKLGRYEREQVQHHADVDEKVRMLGSEVQHQSRIAPKALQDFCDTVGITDVARQKRLGLAGERGREHADGADDRTLGSAMSDEELQEAIQKLEASLREREAEAREQLREEGGALHASDRDIPPLLVACPAAHDEFGGEYETVLGERVDGLPTWKRKGGDAHVQSSNGFWCIASSRQGASASISGKGGQDERILLQQHVRHSGAMPFEVVNVWDRWDVHQEEYVTDPTISVTNAPLGDLIQEQEKMIWTLREDAQDFERRGRLFRDAMNHMRIGNLSFKHESIGTEVLKIYDKNNVERGPHQQAQVRKAVARLVKESKHQAVHVRADVPDEIVRTSEEVYRDIRGRLLPELMQERGDEYSQELADSGDFSVEELRKEFDDLELRLETSKAATAELLQEPTTSEEASLADMPALRTVLRAARMREDWSAEDGQASPISPTGSITASMMSPGSVEGLEAELQTELKRLVPELRGLHADIVSTKADAKAARHQLDVSTTRSAARRRSIRILEEQRHLFTDAVEIARGGLKARDARRKSFTDAVDRSTRARVSALRESMAHALANQSTPTGDATGASKQVEHVVAVAAGLGDPATVLTPDRRIWMDVFAFEGMDPHGKNLADMFSKQQELLEGLRAEERRLDQEVLEAEKALAAKRQQVEDNIRLRAVRKRRVSSGTTGPDAEGQVGDEELLQEIRHCSQENESVCEEINQICQSFMHVVVPNQALGATTGDTQEAQSCRQAVGLSPDEVAGINAEIVEKLVESKEQEEDQPAQITELQREAVAALTEMMSFDRDLKILRRIRANMPPNPEEVKVCRRNRQLERGFQAVVTQASHLKEQVLAHKDVFAAPLAPNRQISLAHPDAPARQVSTEVVATAEALADALSTLIANVAVPAKSKEEDLPTRRASTNLQHRPTAAVGTMEDALKSVPHDDMDEPNEGDNDAGKEEQNEENLLMHDDNNVDPESAMLSGGEHPDASECMLNGGADGLVEDEISREGSHNFEQGSPLQTSLQDLDQQPYELADELSNGSEQREWLSCTEYEAEAIAVDVVTIVKSMTQAEEISVEELSSLVAQGPHQEYLTSLTSWMAARTQNFIRVADLRDVLILFLSGRVALSEQSEAQQTAQDQDEATNEGSTGCMEEIGQAPHYADDVPSIGIGGNPMPLDGDMSATSALCASGASNPRSITNSIESLLEEGRESMAQLLSTSPRHRQTSGQRTHTPAGSKSPPEDDVILSHVNADDEAVRDEMFE